MLVAAPAPAVLTLDGRPVVPPPRAIVAGGRTLLGIRSLGEALGATVAYEPVLHAVAVARNGRRVTVRVARITGGRAYAGLREVAAALGFDAAYAAATHTVALRSPRTPARAAAAVPPAAERSAIPALVTQKYPQPGGSIADAYPAISARIEPQGGAPVEAAAIRLTIDAEDVTGRAAVIGDEIVYTPRVPLADGRHDVRISGSDRAGVAFADEWSFTSNYLAPSNAPAGTGLASVFLDRIPRPGDRYFDVVAYGAPGGYGYVTIGGLPAQYMLLAQGINRYVAHVTVPLGVDLAYAYASVHFVDARGTIVDYTVPSPLRIYTIVPAYGPGVTGAAQPAPVPTPAPTGIPVMPHRTFVRPPAPTPAPAVTPTRIPLLHATPAPSPAPASHKRFLLAKPPATPGPAQAPATPATPAPQTPARATPAPRAGS